MAEYPDLDEVFRLQWLSQGTSQGHSQLPGTVTTYAEATTPTPVPDVVPRSRAHETAQASSQCPPAHRENLSFLEEEDWDPDKPYNGDRFHYLIEWKVRLNGKAVANQSEPNVVVSLDCYWRLVLQDRLEQVVRRRFAKNRRLRHEHTAVVVSVTERSQRDLSKEYEGTEIDWAVANNQLLDWSPHFQKGKKLRVNLSFNFVEQNAQSASRSARRGDKRGRKSASSGMLADRDREIAAEQDATGEPPVWPDLYAFMRCPTFCEAGPHCWIDSEGNHHRMKAEYFKRLEEHVARHGMLSTHSDMPLDLQRQLVADRQRQGRRGKKQISNSDPPLPPITITNVLPGQPPQASQAARAQDQSTPRYHSDATRLQQVEFWGFRDDALRRYAEWQQSRVRDPSVKADIGRAYDVAMKKRIFLEMMCEHQTYRIFVDEGVPVVVAWYFTWPKDIETFGHYDKRVRLDTSEDGRQG
ncbi:uncharacterized protein PV07_12589 [Cladophialophora immunda]|uniref:Uncharacterized protein n=1 Tax=Cladophialophora immunda TaxID=569365 RepID=A0A0D2CER9_9EURO|nr:uncharacterized protein PV07_12589 [Cladophialophora immunda]KIW22004.1 hypothetical protein PV07_12589 [Cladophialophora immunda]